MSDYVLPPASIEVDISDDGLRAFWRQYGGDFHGPKIETGTMPEARLLPFLRYLITTVPIAKSPEGTITDAREAKSERDRFEGWMQRYHADSWPNPDSEGSYTWPDGTYRNRALNERWQAWQAALEPAEVATRAQRLEFAATAIGVLERRRDELKAALEIRNAQLAEQPHFVAVRGCQPGDVVFLAPNRDLSFNEMMEFRKSLEILNRELSIKAVLLPAGFTVQGKPAGDAPAEGEGG